QARINEVVAELIAIDVFPAAKYLAGRPVGDLGPCRRPFAPLSRESKARLDRLVDRLAELIELTERDERSGRSIEMGRLWGCKGSCVLICGFLRFVVDRRKHCSKR